MENIYKLIANHKMLALEVWEQLEELNKLDLTKFSEKEKTELLISISELETEYSMRRSFQDELESLL
jgi:hypothetical protein